MHDWQNYKTCRCGEHGCGSYRPFPDGPTMREMAALWAQAEADATPSTSDNP